MSVGALQSLTIFILFQVAVGTALASPCDVHAKNLAAKARTHGVNLTEHSKIEKLFTYFKYHHCAPLPEDERRTLHEELFTKAENQMNTREERSAAQTQHWGENEKLQKLISYAELQKTTEALKLVSFRYAYIELFTIGNEIIKDRRLFIHDETQLCQNYPLGCKVVFRKNKIYLRFIEPLFATIKLSVKNVSPKYAAKMTYGRDRIKNISACPDLRSCRQKKVPLRVGSHRPKTILAKNLVPIAPQKNTESLYIHIPEKKDLTQKLNTLEKKLDELKRQLLFNFEVIKKPVKLLFIINVCGFTVQNKNGDTDYHNHLDYAFSQIVEFIPTLPPGSTFKISITSSNKEWPDDYILSSHFLPLPETLAITHTLIKHNRSFKELTEPDIIYNWMSTLPLQKKAILNTLNEGMAPIIEDMANWKDLPDLMVSFSDGWPGTEPQIYRERKTAADSNIPIQFKPIGSKHIEKYFSIIPDFDKGDSLLPGDTGSLTLQIYLDLVEEIRSIKYWINQP